MTIKEVYKLADLFNAVVVDNCATLRLNDGSYAVYKGGVINPEYGQFREFFDWDGDSVNIAVFYE